MDYFVANENSNDTLADLRYFKNLDNSIKQKLDSFLVYVKSSKRSNEDKIGFIEFCFFKNTPGRIMVDLSLNAQYAAYRIHAFKWNNFGNVFAFSFYKSHLVLFTLSTNKHRIKEEFSPLLNELMYAELSKDVQQEIDKKATGFSLESISIVKRYSID